MEILILLVERSGGVVSRQELSERLWSHSDPEAVKQSINNAVNRIRYTLRDTTEEPRYIQTVIGKGYQFVAAIQVVQVGAGERAPALEGAHLKTNSPAENSDSGPAAAVSEHSGVTAGLASLLSTGEVDRKPNLLQRRRTHGFLALAGALVCAFLLWFGMRHHAKPALDTGAHAFDLTRLTSNASSNWITAAAISPDGKRIVLAEPSHMQIRSIDGTERSGLPTPDLRVIDRLAWFADNNQFLVSGLERASGTPEVWLYSRAGYGAVKMRSDARMGVPSPAGSQIAFTNGSMSELWIMDILGQQPRKLLQGAANTTFSLLSWGPDGRTLLIQRLEHDARLPAPAWDSQHAVRASYLAVDVADGRVRTSLDSMWMQDAVLLARNELLYTQFNGTALALWSVILDPGTGAFRSAPRFLQELHTRNLTAAEDGTLAGIVVNLRPQVNVGALADHPLRLEDVHALTDERYSAYPHSWSADSSSLYFELLEGTQWRIRSQPLQAAQPLQAPGTVPLVDSKLNQATPRFTPDHRWLLFAGRVPGTQPSQIFRVLPGGGVPQLVQTDGPAGDFRCPLRAGACLLRRLDGLKRLVFLPLDPERGVGPPVTTLAWNATNDLGDWDVSPDGRQLVLTSPQKSEPSLMVIDLPSGHTVKVSLDVHRPIESVNWDAAGKGWFISLANGRGRDILYATSHSPPVLLRQTTGATYAVPSPDGRKLAFVDQGTDSNVWLLRRR